MRPEQLPSRLGRYPDWDTYIDSRIALWLEAEPQGLAPDPFLRLVASWLDANRPEPVPLGLVHGDFHPANVIVTSDDEYMAVDWELAHVGDPREDLGWMALAAEAQPPDLVGSDADSFYATYCKAANLPVEAIDEKALMYFLVAGVDRLLSREPRATRASLDRRVAHRRIGLHGQGLTRDGAHHLQRDEASRTTVEGLTRMFTRPTSA